MSVHHSRVRDSVSPHHPKSLMIAPVRSLLLVMLPIFVSAMSVPALAQPVKAAYTEDVTEGRITPLRVQIPMVQSIDCVGEPGNCAIPVPAGKRFVIEHFSGFVAISGGFILNGAELRLPAGPAYFPLTVQVAGDPQRSSVSVPFRAYLDAGQVVGCGLNGIAGGGGTVTVAGECALFGYLIDKR
jgi:hypothetical protein